VRTPNGASSVSRNSSAGKAGRALLSGVLAVSLAGTIALITVPAKADPKPPVIPSQSTVDAAKRAAAAKAAQVAAIEQQLASANDRLEELGRAAGRADEAYNGAVYRLQQAKTEATAAAARAAKAQQTLDGERRQIGRFAAASYQGGGDLAKLGPLFSADGPQELLDSAGAAHSVSAAMQGSYLRYTAMQVVTNAFRMQADQAVAKVKAATDAAAAAKARAEAAEAAQAAAVASMGAERNKQISQLATLRNTSYRVAAQRQSGLEELARERAAALAAKKAAELRKRIAAREAAERAKEAAHAAKQGPKTPKQGPKTPKQGPKTTPKRKPDGGHESSGLGASAAIAFALAQLGDPYVWGATGPDSWDCSGLTMGAWAHAGVQLPHYSVAQYEQTKHISADELRPGDLIFWADDANDPSTIFHVAMYLGGGEMIHAPRTGKPVKLENVYYWQTPDFFGRP
jgi:cell wall-associated NlpC family hydrolase